jgi:hypothetical protein
LQSTFHAVAEQPGRPLSDRAILVSALSRVEVPGSTTQELEISGAELPYLSPWPCGGGGSDASTAPPPSSSLTAAIQLRSCAATPGLALHDSRTGIPAWHFPLPPSSQAPVPLDTGTRSFAAFCCCVPWMQKAPPTDSAGHTDHGLAGDCERADGPELGEHTGADHWGKRHRCAP